MSGIPTPKNSVANALKIYLFPSLVTILAMMIWRDVTELRTDVKQLLGQSNIDKTEIQNLKRDVQMLNHQVFKTPPIAASENVFSGTLLVSHDRFFKHEDIYDVTDYISDLNYKKL